jgi:hypothetical protein
MAVTQLVFEYLLVAHTLLLAAVVSYQFFSLKA